MRKLTWGPEEAARAQALGAKIAKARKELGLTQGALARQLGLTQGRIARVEIGHTDLSRRMIAEAVGVFQGRAALATTPEGRTDRA